MTNASFRVVVLSGPISAGKTTLAENLRDRYGARVIKTRDLILQKLPTVRQERGALQRAGERLDKADGGLWVKEALFRFIDQLSSGSIPSGLFVVDAVRIPGQVQAIRDAYGTAVHHIHLCADTLELEKRYARRGSRTEEFIDYALVRQSRTEREVARLADLADIVVATDRSAPDAILVRKNSQNCR